MPREALMRLLPATVGTRLQKAGSNRWTSETCLTPTNLANECRPNFRLRGVLTGCDGGTNFPRAHTRGDRDGGGWWRRPTSAGRTAHWPL